MKTASQEHRGLCSKPQVLCDAIAEASVSVCCKPLKSSEVGGSYWCVAKF